MGHTVKRSQSCLGENAAGAVAESIVRGCAAATKWSGSRRKRRRRGAHKPNERADEPMAKPRHRIARQHERRVEGLGSLVRMDLHDRVWI